MVKQIFKEKKFGVIDSDVIIDFQKKNVEFQNPLTIKDRYILLPTLFIGASFSFLYIAVSPMNPLIWLFFVIPSLFLASYGFTLGLVSLNTPTVGRFIEKMNKKILRSDIKPINEFIIKNPFYYKSNWFGGFEIILQGECANYCDKAILRRTKIHETKASLEITFLEQKTGTMIIKEYAT